MTNWWNRPRGKVSAETGSIISCKLSSRRPMKRRASGRWRLARTALLTARRKFSRSTILSNRFPVRFMMCFPECGQYLDHARAVLFNAGVSQPGNLLQVPLGGGSRFHHLRQLLVRENRVYGHCFRLSDFLANVTQLRKHRELLRTENVLVVHLAPCASVAPRSSCLTIDIIDTKGPKGCRTLLDPASVDRQHLVTTQEPIQLGLGLFGILNRNGEEAKCHMWSLVHMSISNFSPGAAPLP